jgi:surface polysaccharide O-acyltransferase-like enzyme
VFHHFAVHGGFEWSASSVSTTRFWYNLIVMGGKIGVNIFVLISGYYLVNSDQKIFNPCKVAKIVGQVWFYSVVILIISVIFGLQSIADIGIKSLIKTLFPITFSRWWFASAYFVLYLFHPFLNKLLHSLDKPLYQKLLLILVVCWSIISTFTTSSFQCNNLLWFVTLYAIAGYIRLYGLNHKFKTKHYTAFLLIFLFLTYISSVVLTILGSKWPFFMSYVTYFYGQEKITILLISICLFMVFAMQKINYHKWINILASATFGVYLIHDNYEIRQFLWIELFKNAHYQDSLFLIPYSVIVVAIVYIVCSLVDLLRQFIFERPYMKLINYIDGKKTNKVEKIVVLLKDFIFGKST